MGNPAFGNGLTYSASGAVVNWIISDFAVRIFLTARRVAGCMVRVAGLSISDLGLPILD